MALKNNPRLNAKDTCPVNIFTRLATKKIKIKIVALINFDFCILINKLMTPIF